MYAKSYGGGEILFENPRSLKLLKENMYIFMYITYTIYNDNICYIKRICFS